MNYVGSGTATFTKGLQINSTTAFEVTGSPNIGAQYVGSNYPDNTFITFAWGTCFPTGGLNATDIADVSFKANWSSNNTPIGAQFVTAQRAQQEPTPWLTLRVQAQPFLV